MTTALSKTCNLNHDGCSFDAATHPRGRLFLWMKITWARARSLGPCGRFFGSPRPAGGRLLRHLRGRILLLLALGLLWLTSCAANPTPTPTALPHATIEPTTTATPLPPVHTSTPAATPSPHPAAKDEEDAFAVTYFPWADPSVEAFPRHADEGKVKVVNSIFFDEPPFFGFDIQSGGRWYHVVGVDHWAVTDAERISPTINRHRRPRDGDTVIVWGEVREQFLIASYVGFTDGTPWYYRSLLQADELAPGVLPSVYDGLEVWVRDVLDTSERWGQSYVLPEGASLDSGFAGQEALAAGQLFTKGGVRVNLTKGVYIRNDGRYANILGGEPFGPVGQTYEQGTIRAVGYAGRLAGMQSEDGRFVEVSINEPTSIEFADGSPADLAELSPGRRIEAIGQASGTNKLLADKVTIVGTTASGPEYAAYIAGVNGDLWSVSLDGLERRQITHLAAPASARGLAEAAFSPDGQRFVFARQNRSQATLVLGDLQSGELREVLTDDGWQETDPAWSPEGSRIVFCRYRLEGAQRMDGGLWLLNLSTGATKRLLPPAREGWLTVSPRWSPDGKHMAFGQAKDMDAGERMSRLYVLSLPASSRWVLAYPLEWHWSADSTQLLCTRHTPSERCARLWIVQRDGSSATWLSVAGVHEHHGRWSPDGTAIAFLSRPEDSSGRSHLWIMRADGMRRVQLTDDRLPAASLAWSADSEALVFMKVTAGRVYDGLWILGRDGSGLRELAG